MSLPYPENYRVVQNQFLTAMDGIGRAYRVFNTFNTINNPDDDPDYYYVPRFQVKEWTGDWENTEWGPSYVIPDLDGWYTYAQLPSRVILGSLHANGEGRLYLIYSRYSFGYARWELFMLERSPAGTWGSPVCLWPELLQQMNVGGDGALGNDYYNKIRLHFGSDAKLYLIPKAAGQAEPDHTVTNWNPPVFVRDAEGNWSMEQVDTTDENIDGYYWGETRMASGRNGDIYWHGQYYSAPAWDGAFELVEKKDGVWLPRERIYGDCVQPDFLTSSVSLGEQDPVAYRPWSGFVVAGYGTNYWGPQPTESVVVVASSDLTFSEPARVSSSLTDENQIAQRMEVRYGGANVGDFTIDGLDLNTSQPSVTRRVEVINHGGAVNGCQVTVSCTIGTVLMAMEYQGDTMEDAIGRGMYPTLYSPPVGQGGSFFFWLKWTAPTPKVYGANEVTLTLEVS